MRHVLLGRTSRGTNKGPQNWTGDGCVTVPNTVPTYCFCFFFGPFTIITNLPGFGMCAIYFDLQGKPGGSSFSRWPSLMFSPSVYTGLLACEANGDLRSNPRYSKTPKNISQNPCQDLLHLNNYWTTISKVCPNFFWFKHTTLWNWWLHNKHRHPFFWVFFWGGQVGMQGRTSPSHVYFQ